MLCLAVLLQYRSGTYASEFGHEPDEPSHVVTALMFHDYITSAIPQHPVRYAENYYLHYPKVAIGMWPPFFYLLAAIWMCIFPASHGSLLVFIAVNCALIATLVALVVRRRFGALLGCLSGALFVSFYLIQYGTSLFMVDVTVALFAFASMLLLVRFFQTERTVDAVWFGIVTGLAILTKGNAMALILMVPLMIAGLRRWSILRRPGLYVSAALVAIVGGPWQLVTMRMLKTSVPLVPVDTPRIWHMVSGYAGYVLESTGYLVLLVVLLGLATCLWEAFRTPRAPAAIETMGLASLACAVYLFDVAMAAYPGPESRYITPLFPVVPVFFAAGIARVCDWLPAGLHRRSWLRPVAALLVLAIYAVMTFATPARPPLGYTQAVETLSWPGLDSDGVILVSADGFGEGALVAGVALRDRRPARFVLRGSKVINEGRWSVRIHDPLLRTPEEMQRYLQSVPVDAVVVDRTAPLWQQDTDTLIKTLTANHESWRLETEIPASGSRRNILVYRYVGPRDPFSKRNIQLRLRFTLGRDLKL